MRFKRIDGHVKYAWTWGMIAFVTIGAWGQSDAMVILYGVVAYYWFFPTYLPDQQGDKRWPERSWQIGWHTIGLYILAIGMCSFWGSVMYYLFHHGRWPLQ